MPRRSRNFDGCWTCRIRKIKCDTTRPKCMRCQRANLECKGYDVVLAWADISTVDRNSLLINVSGSGSSSGKDNGSSRRSVEIVKYPNSMTYETYSQLESVIGQLDEITPTHHSHFIGPFGVFVSLASNHKSPKTERASHTGETNGMPPHASRPVNSTSPGRSIASVSNIDNGPSIFSKTENSFVHYDLLDYAKLTILAIKGPRVKFDEQGMLHILYPKLFPNIESDDWRPSHSILSSVFTMDDKNSIILSSSICNTFSLFMNSILSSVRVSTSPNYWEKLVSPFLKSLFYEIICEEYPITKSWRGHMIARNSIQVSRDHLIKNIKFAIFCMTLAISWFEKSSLTLQCENNDVDSFIVNDELKTSIIYRKIAIRSLNYHLDEYSQNSSDDPFDDYDTYFILALILQIHLDNVFGVFENFELVYAIGDFILKRKSLTWMHQSPLLRQLREILGVLNTFYESTQSVNFFNYAIPEDVRKTKYPDLSENYDLTKFTSDSVARDSESESDEESDASDHSGLVNVEAKSTDQQSLTFTVKFNNESTKRKNSSISKLNPKRSLASRDSEPLTPSVTDFSTFTAWGLPQALLDLLNEVVQITNHKNVFKNLGVTPRNFPLICADIEDRLLNWDVEKYWKLYNHQYDPIQNVSKKVFISKFHEGLFHNVYYFQNALIVYYKRLIPNNPIKCNQKYIKACFFHMERLLAINNTQVASNSKVKFNPMFWPLLVCGCDIDLKDCGHLRDKCQGFWQLDCFRKFNYWRSKQILFEVWYRRTENGEDISFMEMVQEWGIVLSLG